MASLRCHINPCLVDYWFNPDITEKMLTGTERIISNKTFLQRDAAK